jgi:lysophospholipase L1-like esterase
MSVLLAAVLAVSRAAVAQDVILPGDACIPTTVVKNMLESRTGRLRDWPDLARYREADAKAGLPAPGKARVVFMGDSITEGWASAPAGFFPGKPYLGRGISGQTTPQMLLRFRSDVIALKPKAVVILGGTNDLAENSGPITLEETEGNLASMAELARANGVRVVLSSLTPVRGGKRSPEKILALNAWLKKYAEKNGHVYLDYFAAMADEGGAMKKEYSGDGLHPNAAGYARMAPLAEAAIRAALAPAGR